MKTCDYFDFLALNHPCILVTGKLDRIFYRKIVSQLGLDASISCYQEYERAKNLIKYQKEITLMHEKNDYEVLKKLATDNRKNIIGIIDYDDGINYYSSFKNTLKRDLKNNILYTDGADLESMVMFYDLESYIFILSKVTNINYIDAKDYLNSIRRESAKLRKFRLTKYSNHIIQNGFVEHWHPGFGEDLSNEIDEKFYRYNVKLEAKNDRPLSQMLTNGKIDFNKWFEYCFSGLSYRVIPYKARLKSLVENSLTNIEDSVFRKWLDNEAANLINDEHKKNSYLMRGHDIEPFMNEYFNIGNDFDYCEICNNVNNISDFEEFGHKHHMKFSEIAILNCDVSKFINNDIFKRSEFCKRLMLFIKQNKNG